MANEETPQGYLALSREPQFCLPRLAPYVALAMAPALASARALEGSVNAALTW
jgi:hypothetical protein